MLSRIRRGNSISACRMTLNAEPPITTRVSRNGPKTGDLGPSSGRAQQCPYRTRESLKINSNVRAVDQGSTQLPASPVAQAHNPAAAGSLVQIQPPQPILGRPLLLQNGCQKFRIDLVDRVCVFVGCVCCTPTGNHTGQPPANFAQAPSGAGCAPLAFARRRRKGRSDREEPNYRTNFTPAGGGRSRTSNRRSRRAPTRSPGTRR